MKNILYFLCFVCAFCSSSSDANLIKYYDYGSYIEKTYKGVTYNAYFCKKDSSGRRRCTVNPAAKEYALFLGCSYIFGDGVNDEDTLPEIFQRHSLVYQAYNYGYCGDGPNNTLYRFMNNSIRAQISQKTGICFYFYPVGTHEKRIRLHYGDLFCENSPYYKIKNNKLVNCGSLKKVQPLTYLLVKLYEIVPIPETKKKSFPNCNTRKNQILLADILFGVRDEYKRQFNNDNFYVVLHPGSLRNSDPIVNILNKKGLKVICFPDIQYLYKNKPMKYRIGEFDGHPNALMNKILGEALAIKINLQSR